MTTNYALTDQLPKDAGGAKILAPVNDQSSVLDFGLFRGIGAESLGAGSQNVLHLAVGTHTAGSKLDKYAGVLLLGAYTESPSAIGTGNAAALRSDKEGALYVRPASGIMSISSASVENHINGSALLHDIHISFVNVNAGDNVLIEDGNNYALRFTATATSQYFSEHFSTGLFFGTCINHTFTFGGAGTGSVTLGYSRY